MKKAVLSPLCSALVVPGLGQIINQNLKKGAIILFCVFALIVAGVIKLYQVIRTILAVDQTGRLDSGFVMDRLRAEDLYVLGGMIAAFAVLWLYSVLDAYLVGKRMDTLSIEELS